MNTVIAVFVGLMLSAPVVAESLVEGQVRLSSGEPVEAAQIMVFDWADLRRGAVAQATTDAAGYFALPLALLGGSALPQAWTLGQNYPNPFNPSTLIPYQLPMAAQVRLEVFNVLGQRVATLVDEERPAGVHTAAWNATDAAGRAVGAGVYFYRLSSAGQPTLTRRMVLLDGQAGQTAASVPLPMGPSPAAAVEGVYGLAVTGTGLVSYVDAAFGVRSGMAPVEVVVEGVEGLPRGKALSGGILGDVNGDGQVTLDDVVLIMTYSSDGSVELPTNGDISLGDVNGDGQVNIDDAQLLIAYVANPADPSLPEGIGQAVTSSGGDWVAGPIRRLTDHPASDWSPSWSPDGRHIAFGSRRDGNYEIYVMGSDGSNLRRLTNHWAGDWSPSWSPDGRHIAFVSSRERGGKDEIYVMGSDGSNPRRLTDHSAWDWSPSWSPDGRHIAFVSDRDGNYEIYVMGSDGSNPRRLTDHSGSDHSPSWSPDGRHIAFESWGDGNGGIYVMGSDGSNPRRLTDDWVMDHSPSWSPDGRHIAFMSDRDDNNNIYVMGSDGSNPRRLIDHSARDWSPSWSPDGRHIAFVSDRDGNSEIYVMELRETGSGRTPLDEGDSPATAIPLAVGASVEGELSADDSDYFSVTVSNAGTLMASTTGSTDTYGSIEDRSGNVLNENDDGGEGRNFRVSAAVGPGTYYIRVRGFDTSITGAYRLTLQMEVGSASYGGDWVAGPIRRLTNHSARDWSPSWSPDGRHIAFESRRDGKSLFVMGSDGSNPRGLANGFGLSWSPDGRHILFWRLHLWVMDSDGTNIRLLTEYLGDGLSCSWSPDSRHIVFRYHYRSTRENSSGIAVMDSDGTNIRLLTTNYGFNPFWSPDGRHIAFHHYGEIYVMGSDGSNPRFLTYGSGWPFWSPDGRHLAFVHSDDIYVIGVNGSNPRFLTYGSDPTWSPDGRHIAFKSYRDYNSDIYVMGSDGSNLRRLTDHPASDWSPSWSPDGRHIAFVSDRDDNWEIYVIELREAGSN